MLKNLLISAASGYVLKVVQVFCNLVLVPFLIADSNIGLAGYGTLAVLLAAVGLVATSLDGWRLSTARRFGLAKKSNEKIYLPLLVLTVFPLLLLSVLVANVSGISLEWLGVESIGDHMLILLMLYLLLEQVNALSEQCFHAAGMTWLVNLVVLFEVVLRTVVLLWMLAEEASLSLYFEIFIVAMTVKYLTYSILLFWGGHIGTLSIAALTKEGPTFIQSLPLSLKSLSIYAVFRMTVIFVYQLFSPELAAIYAILMVTIRGYIMQLFVAVIRPMIVPLTASIDIAKLRGEHREIMISALSSYDFVVMTATVSLAFLSPWWLPIWLRMDVSNYVPFFMVGIITLGLEASTSVKNLLLISQGHGLALTRVTVAVAAVYLVYLLVICQLWQQPPMVWLLGGVLVFVGVVSGLLIPAMFGRRVVAVQRYVLVKYISFYVVSLSLAVSLGYMDRGYQLPYLLVALAILLALYGFWIYNPASDALVRAKINTLRDR